MPKRRYKKRSYKRRRKYSRKMKRKRPWRSKISWRKMPLLFPDKCSVKLKYFSSVRSEPPGTQAINRAYRLNGLNNVDQNVNLGKPNCFVEWSQFYEKYHVRASSIRLKVFNIDTTDIVFCYLMPVSSDEAVPGTFPTYTTAREFPYTSSRVITSARASQMDMMKNYISVKKLTGRTIVDDDYTASTVATAPADNPINFYSWAVLFSADTTQDLNIYYELTINYYVTFFERRVVLPSN